MIERREVWREFWFVFVVSVVCAVGLNALFCEAGTVHESEGLIVRLLIGGCFGVLLALAVLLDE